jgi:Flp pilus assembly protein TadG
MAAVDRPGRSVVEITRTIAELGERGITLRALRETVDTATPTGRAVATTRRALLSRRTKLGLIAENWDEIAAAGCVAEIRHVTASRIVGNCPAPTGRTAWRLH